MWELTSTEREEWGGVERRLRDLRLAPPVSPLGVICLPGERKVYLKCLAVNTATTRGTEAYRDFLWTCTLNYICKNDGQWRVFHFGSSCESFSHEMSSSCLSQQQRHQWEETINHNPTCVYRHSYTHNLKKKEFGKIAVDS